MYRLTCIFLVAAALFSWDANEDLLSAARTGDLATVKSLIEKGTPIEAKTPYGQTPLYLAAMGGHADVVQFLLDKGANADVTDTFYKAPMLGFVVDRKHIDIAKMIIAKGTGSPDAQLKQVAENAELVQAVLNKGKPSQAVLDSTYESALSDNHKDVAELLKKAGAHEPSPPMVVDPKVLESYAGNFKTDTIPLDIKVFVKEGKLYLQGSGQPPFAPKPKSPTVFSMAQFNLEVEFDSPSTFTLKQGSMVAKYKKVAAQ